MRVLKPEDWVFGKCPPASDIVWDNFSYSDRHVKTLLRTLTWMILIIISIVLITPLTILDNLNPLLTIVDSYLGEYQIVSSYFQFFVTPFCLYIFNYILIPFLIDFLITFERRSRKSHKAKTKFRKNFFFFVLNQIFLPLAGFKTIYSFLQFLTSFDLSDWPEVLAGKINPNGGFFLRYLIQVSLISNTFQLLSLNKKFWDFYYSHNWFWRRKNQTTLNLADYYINAAFYSGKWQLML